MATINNVFKPNVSKGGGTEDAWNILFTLTRALKKAGWKVIASSDSATKTVSDDPELDEFGPGVATGTSGAGAAVAAPVNGRAAVTGLAGITAADKGRMLHFTTGAAANQHYHQIEEVVSAAEVKIDARRSAFTPISEAGPLNWEIIDPSADASYGSTNMWWCGEGPGMVRIPITAAPTPGASFNFIRGENVVQTTTGAEGEIRGWVFADGAGHLVIAPRVRGSGNDPYGWDDTYLVTGDTSGATVPQDGSALAATVQVAIKRHTGNSTGQFYVNTVIRSFDPATYDFVTLAGSAGCTAAVMPGAGGTGNGFPSSAWVLNGSGGSGTAYKWNGANSQEITGNGQLVAMDVLEEAGHSPDPSFLCAIAGLTENTGHTGYFLCICDDGEPGDLTPYVTLTAPSSAAWSEAGSAPRTNSGQSSSANQDYFSSETWDNSMGVSHSPFRGYTRTARTTPTPEGAFHTFQMGIIFAPQSNIIYSEANAGTGTRFLTDPTTPTPATVREPMFAVCTQTGRRSFKGTMRHFSMVNTGGRLSTYDGGKHLQLSGLLGCMVWSPWDESTVPSAF